MALIPFIFILFSYLLWKLLSIICKSRFQLTYKRNCIAFTLVFIFLIYPSIIKNCFELLNCTTIDGVTYLRKSYEIVCW
jgi:hypothetical protein